jgi:putative endonuclease
MARECGPPRQSVSMSNTYYVYILASRKNGTLYIGVTNDLIRRVWEHREGLNEGFTKKYGVKMLVYFEAFEDIDSAIHRETRMKKWKRRWKMRVIEEKNYEWRDLYDVLNGGTALPGWPAVAGHDNLLVR